MNNGAGVIVHHILNFKPKWLSYQPQEGVKSQSLVFINNNKFHIFSIFHFFILTFLSKVFSNLTFIKLNITHSFPPDWRFFSAFSSFSWTFCSCLDYPGRSELLCVLVKFQSVISGDKQPFHMSIVHSNEPIWIAASISSPIEYRKIWNFSVSLSMCCSIAELHVLRLAYFRIQPNLRWNVVLLVVFSFFGFLLHLKIKTIKE